MAKPVRSSRNAFILAGTTLVLSVASLATSFVNATPSTKACPISGIVKCIPPPGQRTVAAFIGQPLTWVGIALLVIAIIGAIVGITRRNSS